MVACAQAAVRKCRTGVQHPMVRKYAVTNIPHHLNRLDGSLHPLHSLWKPFGRHPVELLFVRVVDLTMRSWPHRKAAGMVADGAEVGNLLAPSSALSRRGHVRKLYVAARTIWHSNVCESTCGPRLPAWDCGKMA